MRAYHVFGEDTSTASTTILHVRQPASALKRLALTYVAIGSDATADNAYEAAVKRTTANGSGGTSVTPQPRDPADGAASATAEKAPTSEPTYTANSEQLEIWAHQRSTFQWFASPGHEIVVAATNNAGLGLLVVTCATTFNMGVTFEFEE